MACEIAQKNATTTNRNGNYLFWRSISLVATCNCSDCRMCLLFMLTTTWMRLFGKTVFCHFCATTLLCSPLIRIRGHTRIVAKCTHWHFRRCNSVDHWWAIASHKIDNQNKSRQNKQTGQHRCWSVRSAGLIDFSIQRMVDGFMFYIYANSHSLDVHAITLSLLTVNKRQPA